MGYQCRCSKCRTRKTLPKHPEDYKIIKFISCCCGGVFLVDSYRNSGKERKKNKTCNCGNWWFPHKESIECPNLKQWGNYVT